MFGCTSWSTRYIQYTSVPLRGPLIKSSIKTFTIPHPTAREPLVRRSFFGIAPQEANDDLDAAVKTVRDMVSSLRLDVDARRRKAVHGVGG